MEDAADIGAGLWRSTSGMWELVRVRHREADDRFFFQVGDHTYGEAVGGFGRNELATLYLLGKLTLCPQRLIAEGYSSCPAVICNRLGVPVLAEWEPSDGVQHLVADPAFHAAAPTDE